MNTAFRFYNKKIDRDRQLSLEQLLIAQYLLDKGYRQSDMQDLPVAQRKELMKQACIYASIRLADIEAKSIFIQKISAH